MCSASLHSKYSVPSFRICITPCNDSQGFAGNEGLLSFSDSAFEPQDAVSKGFRTIWPQVMWHRFSRDQSQEAARLCVCPRSARLAQRLLSLPGK